MYFNIKIVYLVWQMIENERDRITTFSTGCPIIDETLEGGIRLGQVTEVYGESGCGKTQLCIQMALEVQRTFRLHEQEASEILIDTDNLRLFFLIFHLFS